MASRQAVVIVAWAWPALSLIALLAAIVAAAALWGGSITDRVVTDALVKIVIVVGLYIFIGNSGVMSFGSIAFMAIGAYAAAWQTCCPRLKPINMSGLPDFLRLNTVDLLPAALSSVTFATVLAAIIGFPIMRLSGLAASIATFAVLAVVNVIYGNWDRVTLGTNSVVGIPRYVDMWIALGCAALAIVAAYLYQRSPSGRRLRAASQDEVAAKAAGIDVPRERLIAWTLSAAFVGLGGVLYAHNIGVITINNFYLDMTFITLAMLVIGGLRSLSGAVLGVVVLATAQELLRQVELGFTVGGIAIKSPPGVQEVVIGVAMVAILVLRPAGLTGGREFRWPLGPRDGEKGRVRSRLH